MYVCLYLYVYLFYYVYCVPCTANRKPVCHFTCGLLTFTEARRDGTSDNSASPAPGLQARRRIPWGRAMPVPPPLARGVLSTQRLSVHRRGPCPVHAVRTVRTPIRQQKKRRCMPCRCMPNPPLATGNRTRHVCAADNLQTICKQQALRSYPQGNAQKPCRSWENARPQRLQKMPFGAPNAPIDQLCGLD